MRDSDAETGADREEMNTCAGTTAGEVELSAPESPPKRTIYRHPLRRYGHSRGRPLSTTADPSVTKRAYYLCAEMGATLGQLCKVLPVAQTMLNNWMRYDKTFRSTVKAGIDAWNSAKVEGSLLKRALGYEYDEVTKRDIILYSKHSTGMTVKAPATQVTTVHKVLPPDVGALMFYLTNRMPDRWKNSYRTESSSTTETNIEHNVTVDLSKLGKDDLEILRNIMRRVDPKGAVESPELGSIAGRARQNVLA